MKDFVRIRKAREDITQYCIHLTKNFDTLKEILKCGYLSPGFGVRISRTAGGKDKTIQGSHKAVCFTEQPLWCLVNTIRALDRYKPYGVALKKKFLYNYGGRPVVYGDKNFLKILPKEYKYLWVQYVPDPEYRVCRYPIDWTHEREWRCRGKKQFYLYDGRYQTQVSWEIERVPVLLPEDYTKIRKDGRDPSFRVLVRSKEEVSGLRDFLSHIRPSSNLDKLLRLYFKYLSEAKIVAFEEVKENWKRGNRDWGRFETIPNESK